MRVKQTETGATDKARVKVRKEDAAVAVVADKGVIKIQSQSKFKRLNKD
jgi:hypothetical protein